MKRRDIVVLLGSVAVFPFAVRAQTTRKIPRIGWLAPGSSTAAPYFEAFRQELGELGYVEGQTVAFDARWAEVPTR